MEYIKLIIIILMAVILLFSVIALIKFHYIEIEIKAKYKVLKENIDEINKVLDKIESNNLT